MNRVLIAIREPLIRLGIEVTVDRSPDFQVVGVVEETPEVMPAVARFQPEILVLDVQFRREDERIMSHLSEHHPNCKVLVMVDHGDDECTLRSLLSGPQDKLLDDKVLKQVHECCLLALREAARGCLPKGSGPDRLLSAMRAISAGEIWSGPVLATQFMSSLRQRELEEENAPRLTPREIEIIGLVSDGLSNREIGTNLTLKEQTVKNHVARIMDKLGVRNRVELALMAARQRLA